MKKYFWLLVPLFLFSCYRDVDNVEEVRELYGSIRSELQFIYSKKLVPDQKISARHGDEKNEYEITYGLPKTSSWPVFTVMGKDEETLREALGKLDSTMNKNVENMLVRMVRIVRRENLCAIDYIINGKDYYEIEVSIDGLTQQLLYTDDEFLKHATYSGKQGYFKLDSMAVFSGVISAEGLPEK